MTDFREVHFKKTFSPIVVTEFGMVIEVREVQFCKAKSPIEVAFVGKTTSVCCLPKIVNPII